MKSISFLRQRDAYLSECGQYRYWLTRIWNRSRPFLPWVMLNPSTADAEKDDATIRVVVGRSALLGYGGVVVLNLFAYRATDPKVMKAASDPVGPENMDVILEIARRYKRIMCAWGDDGGHMRQASNISAMLVNMDPLNSGISLWHLGLTKGGNPKHPLRISYSVEPELWKFRGTWKPKSIRVEQGVRHAAKGNEATA